MRHPAQTSSLPSWTNTVKVHERIIVDWHSNLRNAAIKTAGVTVEQVALWMVGGWLFKGAGAALRPFAPRLIGFMRGAGKSRPHGAAEYMETMLTRLPNADKTVVKQLMGKAETQGMISSLLFSH